MHRLEKILLPLGAKTPLAMLHRAIFKLGRVEFHTPLL